MLKIGDFVWPYIWIYTRRKTCIIAVTCTDEPFAGNPAAVCFLPSAREELIGYQASPRGGVIHIRWENDRVRLGGCAVTVLGGKLYG